MVQFVKEESYRLVLLLWSLSLAFTTVWTTTLVAYDDRKIEISRSTPLFKEETTIPFQAIKIIKKEKGGTVNYPSYLINIEYFKDDGEINETQVYSGTTRCTDLF